MTRRAFIVLCFLVLPAFAADKKAPPWEKPLPAGRALYLENCSVCHDADQPKSKKIGPSLFRLWQNERLPYSKLKPEKEIVVSKIKDGSFLMPAFKDLLTDREIELILEYIRTKR